MGCIAAAAGGGYLALRPVPELIQADPIEAAPLASEAVSEPAVIPDTLTDTPGPQPAAAEAPPARKADVAVAKTEVRPPSQSPRLQQPEQTTPSDTDTSPAPAPRPAVTPPVPAPVETVVVPPAPLPVETSVATPPVPVGAEPPRYVPDAPLPAVDAAQESVRFDVEELTVEKHSVIGIRLDESVSTETARVEDRVTATVSRDVTVRGRTAIPADVRLEGTVTLIEHGGRFKNRPRLGLRFDRMILADGTRMQITTDTIYRVGDSPSADSTSKVGAGAVAGAILGAVLGGKKGAVIGGVTGAAGGAAVVMKGEPGEASLPAGAPLTVRLTEDLVVTINR